SDFAPRTGRSRRAATSATFFPAQQDMGISVRPDRERTERREFRCGDRQRRDRSPALWRWRTGLSTTCRNELQRHLSHWEWHAGERWCGSDFPFGFEKHNAEWRFYYCAQSLARTGWSGCRTAGGGQALRAL